MSSLNFYSLDPFNLHAVFVEPKGRLKYKIHHLLVPLRYGIMNYIETSKTAIAGKYLESSGLEVIGKY